MSTCQCPGLLNARRPTEIADASGNGLMMELVRLRSDDQRCGLALGRVRYFLFCG